MINIRTNELANLFLISNLGDFNNFKINISSLTSDDFKKFIEEIHTSSISNYPDYKTLNSDVNFPTYLKANERNERYLEKSLQDFFANNFDVIRDKKFWTEMKSAFLKVEFIFYEVKKRILNLDYKGLINYVNDFLLTTLNLYNTFFTKFISLQKIEKRNSEIFIFEKNASIVDNLVRFYMANNNFVDKKYIKDTIYLQLSQNSYTYDSLYNLIDKFNLKQDYDDDYYCV